MKITYQSDNYNSIPLKFIKRYVRWSTFNHCWECCETDIRKPAYDIRRYAIEENKIPENIRNEAMKFVGKYYAYVEWPREG